jgi:hypothetical protein
LLSKLILRATILCRKRNIPAGRVNRGIASQGAEFYDKSFMFQMAFKLRSAVLTSSQASQFPPLKFIPMWALACLR